MSRGAGWLTAGILLVIVSYCGGVMIQQAFVDSVQSRGPRDAFDTVNRLSPWAGILNLAFYAGVLAVVVGVVLLIIDSSRQPPGSPPPANPAPSAAEEENRRLREELERIRRERGE